MSPRNEWRCFRKSFQVPAEGWSEANLSITADSRYVLYVNGERVGRGPVRCWPFEQAYDTYDIMCHLKPGQTNTVSVLVMHFGINTFYYVRGLGGLLAQLDWTAAAKSGTFSRSELELTSGSILSDETWTTHLHTGHNRRVPRMSMQQAFAAVRRLRLGTG
jgi:alpha-L-rhamnosidase